ncbi:two-component system histidine kinase PnpS [Bacillus glycinifermentans]|uniref:histidine kinase n=1 Tax=Bacillus glycinifermentans TaxID=1664069 RepID=A0A0T6BSY6_9BACI|nr:ATP-binding protein [Bacillus glycinifermentans]ATH92752.1 PAS domain-containing sensor histidine kinase [Bacillus glycinifermentans]KRT94741.1 PAS domain-containing sensor histidine kinase [Bacillus glycinifermentans]MEC0485577.1 ATP-binding protein [Bacillus glycinifermentans]MEC0493523.1 ATP-binding protein [Bacillus glycinifermentans]MEC0541744.1 ATP-binding protein [Bacillus glycinifermentans]
MIKFRTRLLAALLSLLILVFASLGFLLVHLFHTSYDEKLESRIKKEAGFIAGLSDTDHLQSPEQGERLQKASRELDSAVSLIDTKGQVLFHFGGRPDRSVIKKAVQSVDSGEGVRINPDDDSRFSFAQPLKKGGKLYGYILIDSPVDPDAGINQKIWILLGVSLGTAFLIIAGLGARITSQYTTPIESATQVAIELAKGNYNARTFNEDETMLSQSINMLAQNLQDMTRAQEMQRDRLQTVIENIDSGLILIDGKGYIHLVNRAYQKQFHVQADQLLYHFYHEVLEHEEIINLIEEIFMTETKVRKMFHLPIRIERRYFEVDGVPIIGMNDEWKGIVLVFHDMTERKQLEEMRKDFVANVSHELKTPITSIKGFTETLLDGAMNERETLQQFLSIILKESGRLQTLIQDLLDLSKIEQQNFTLNIQDCEIGEILTEIEMLLKNKAEERGIALKLEKPEEPAIASGDPHRLKQIFLNLVNNALTYTPEAGSVTISAEVLEDAVQVKVKDTGIGIKKAEIPRIFERFYRIDKDRSRNSGGTGLGLAIVKHLVEAHHGEIDVESEQGKGTVFTVRLKRAPH